MMGDQGMTGSHGSFSGGMFGQIELTPLWDKNKFAKPKNSSYTVIAAPGILSDLL